MPNSPADATTEEKKPFPYRLIGGAKGEDILESDDESRHRRIQALLAQWMRMENVVVLMGAGCSCSPRIGGLSMYDLESQVLALLERRYRLTSKENLLKVISSRQMDTLLGDHDTPHFEQWLSYLSNIRHLLAAKGAPIVDIQIRVGMGEDPESLSLNASEADELLKDLERAIYTCCALRLPLVTENEEKGGATGHHAFLSKLVARDASLGRSHVFTLNYDTVIEQALDHLGIQYFDGFTGRTEALFDPAAYGLDVYFPGEVAEGRVRRFDKFLHLYKLHGSIHWRERPDQAMTASHSDPSPFVAWRGRTDAEKPSAGFDALWKGKDRRIGILPTSNKFVQTLDMPYAHLFRLFHQRLHVPQTFFLVMGYGFGDDHVNQIIDQAMTNPSLVLLVVTPGKPTSAMEERIRRYRSVGERAFLLRSSKDEFDPKVATFDDFAHNLLPHVQWVEDFRKLKRFENEIRQATSGNAGGGGSE